MAGLYGFGYGLGQMGSNFYDSMRKGIRDEQADRQFEQNLEQSADTHERQGRLMEDQLLSSDLHRSLTRSNNDRQETYFKDWKDRSDAEKAAIASERGRQKANALAEINGGPVPAGLAPQQAPTASQPQAQTNTSLPPDHPANAWNFPDYFHTGVGANYGGFNPYAMNGLGYNYPSTVSPRGRGTNLNFMPTNTRGPAAPSRGAAAAAAAGPAMMPGVGPSNQYEAKAEATGKQPMADYMNPRTYTDWMGLPRHNDDGTIYKDENGKEVWEGGNRRAILAQLDQVRQARMALKDRGDLDDDQKVNQLKELKEQEAYLQRNLSAGDDRFHTMHYHRGITLAGERLWTGDKDGAIKIFKEHGMDDAVDFLKDLHPMGIDPATGSMQWGRLYGTGKKQRLIPVITSEQLGILRNHNVDALENQKALMQVLEANKKHGEAYLRLRASQTEAAPKPTDIERIAGAIAGLSRKESGLKDNIAYLDQQERLSKEPGSKVKFSDKDRSTRIALQRELEVIQTQRGNLKTGSSIGLNTEKQRHAQATEVDKLLSRMKPGESLSHLTYIDDGKGGKRKMNGPELREQALRMLGARIDPDDDADTVNEKMKKVAPPVAGVPVTKITVKE